MGGFIRPQNSGTEFIIAMVHVDPIGPDVSLTSGESWKSVKTVK